MTADTKTPGDKLSVTPTKTLTLKPRSETGVVRQSFSHGRSKAVVVEKVKRRIERPGEAKSAEAAPAAPAPAAAADRGATVRRGGIAPRGVAAAPAPAAPAAPAVAPKKASGVVLRTLTKEEQDRRAHALGDAKVREAEERKIAEEEAKIRAERDAIERTEREAAESRKGTEDERRRHDEETKRKPDEVAKKRFGGEEEAKAKSKTITTAAPVSRTLAPEAEDDDRRPARRGVGGAPARPAAAPKTPRAGAPKQRGRLTLVTALTADEVRERSVASFRRRTQRMTGHRDNENKEKLTREVTIPETITIQELANRMSERGVDVIRLLMRQGEMYKITDVIDADTAQLVAEEMGHTVRRVAESD